MRPALVVLGFVVAGFAAVSASAQSPTLAAAIELQQSVVATEPGRGDGAAWLKLAELEQDAAQYAESEHAYGRAIALMRSGDRAAFADALDHMGTMYSECGRFAKAESLERKALAMREEAKEPLGIGVSHMHLAVLLLGEHNLASAEAEAEMAKGLLVQDAPSSAMEVHATPEQQMTALIDLSLVLCARENCAAALPDLRRAQSIAQMGYTTRSIPCGLLDFLVGYALWKSGGGPNAGAQMKTGIEELSAQLGWGHPTYLNAVRQYESFLRQSGRTVAVK